ncbi:MAG TPA: hypothetical protein P5280_15450, partial [Cyclobacteriaceae bacterium]|nr:hypothetical protein [Cyclobacteriaceae bacterium]
KRCLIGILPSWLYALSRSKKEFEMLVTNKINLFSSLFGKSRSTNMAKVSDGLKALGHKAKNLIDLEGRIDIAKSEDFYKAHNAYVNSPFTQLNK